MNYSFNVGSITNGIRANDAWSSNAKLQNESSGINIDMDEGICLRELQEAQKKLESVLQAEVRKREIRESKFEQEKMKGIAEKLEHITNTLAKMQSPIAKKGKSVLEEEEIIGEPCVISAKEECNTKHEQISEPTRGEIEENRPEIVVDPELDRDRKMHSDASIYSKDFSAQGMHIVNPIPRINLLMYDGFHPRYWIMENNSRDREIGGFVVKNVTSHQLRNSIPTLYFIEFHENRGYDPGGTFKNSSGNCREPIIMEMAFYDGKSRDIDEDLHNRQLAMFHGIVGREIVKSVGADVNLQLFHGFATTAAARESHYEILEILL
ncbi:hypothetical protein ACS0TY_025645 [Phlomoides rotata]